MKDLILRKILLGKEGNQCPNWHKIVSEDNSVKVYWIQCDSSVIIENDILYRRWKTPNLKSYILQIILRKDSNKF